MIERKYSKNEVDAILGRAIEREHQRGELSHEDLVAAAAEVGIPSDAIETAAAEILAERVQRDELAVLRRDQWRGFFSHLIPYLCVNGLLITLNVLTTHFPWSIFPAFGWGIGLFSHFISVLLPNRGRLERRLERKRDRERKYALKQQIRSNARHLEFDIGQGLSAVLQATADRIAGNVPSGNRNASTRTRVVPPSDHQGLSDNERGNVRSARAETRQPPENRRD
jgi:hypothetical protein